MTKFRLALLIFFLTCLENHIHAQLGLQVNAGLMNYGGDLQKSPYTFSESKPTAGINLIYNIKKFAVRAGFTYGSLQADDKKIKQFEARNLNFKTKISEASLCLEYNFLSADNHKLLPYIFAGIGVYHYNPYTYYNNQKVYLQPLGTEGEGLSIYPDRKIYTLTNFENPFGVGVKYKLTSDLLIGVEFNSRYLYTDYLDDVSKTYPDESELFKKRGQLAVDVSFRGDEVNPGLAYPAAGLIRGNPRQNDNYYTSVITLTYIFSEHSLFQGLSGHSKHSLDCPKKVH